jgi:hypothetical protein
MANTPVNGAEKIHLQLIFTADFLFAADPSAAFDSVCIFALDFSKGLRAAQLLVVY